MRCDITTSANVSFNTYIFKGLGINEMYELVRQTIEANEPTTTLLHYNSCTSFTVLERKIYIVHDECVRVEFILRDIADVTRANERLKDLYAIICEQKDAYVQFKRFRDIQDRYP
jgi:hypothetical protein